MTGYQAPKIRHHREFLYLNHDTILNSLSALEAGKVDEIIQKVNEAREGGLEASVGVGPVRGGGRKKMSATVAPCERGVQVRALPGATDRRADV